MAPAALGDNELVALVLGSGRRRLDALAVANELLAARGGLHGLARSSARRFGAGAGHRPGEGGADAGGGRTGPADADARAADAGPAADARATRRRT